MESATHIESRDKKSSTAFSPLGRQGQDLQNRVQVFLTSTEKSGDKSWFNGPVAMEHQLTQADKLRIEKADDTALTTITLDSEKSYQTLLGIGTSLEESTIYNLAKLTQQKREEVLKKLIDPQNGIGMTLFRLCIGSSDFTGRPFYSYYDTPPDGEPDWYNERGQGFSIQKDIDYGIVSTIQDVIRIAEHYGVRDQVKFFASIWSPPGWMKTNTALSGYYWLLGLNADGLCGGAHNPDKKDDLAMYLYRFIEEYEKQGIPIHAITVQNEPWLETAYPSCLMSGNHQAALLLAIKALFKARGCTTKVWAWDHNFDAVQQFIDEYSTVPEAINAMDGIAFHDYNGEPEAMAQVLAQFSATNPAFTVNLTERSVWGASGADRIIQYFRNGAISYNAWVTMLDSNKAPHQWKQLTGMAGEPDPTLCCRRADSDTAYWFMPEMYIIGHFARFIRPGAVRIDSNYGAKETVTNVAWYDPASHHITLVVANQNAQAQTFKVKFGDKQFSATLPGAHVGTYVWSLS